MQPWPAGAATGIGSLPGTDPGEAARLVFGECPDLPFVPELPDRGPGSELIGRGATLLVDLPVEIAPSGWRLCAHPGRDLRRARDLLARDLDAVEAAADGWSGPLKFQVAGPWTLAAGLELSTGHRAVSDHGATRDLAESLTLGLSELLADLARRIPGAQLLFQLDEPSLPAVLGGRVPTPSGYDSVRAVAPATVRDHLRDLLAAVPAAVRVVHCCAPDAPVRLLQEAGAEALAVDTAVLGPADYDALGEYVDAGNALLLGVVRPTALDPDYRAGLARAVEVCTALAVTPNARATTVVPTPGCGLAGASGDQARRALQLVRDIGRALLEDSDAPTGTSG